MLKSMTAYGRAMTSSLLGRIVVEIQSVNRKFLEYIVSLPPELQHLEMEIRKKVSQVVGRGQIIIKISSVYEGEAPVSVIPNIALAKQMKSAWETLAKNLNIDASEFNLELLDRQQVLTFHDNRIEDSAYSSLLFEALGGALSQLERMKVAEGSILQSDIQSRLKVMADVINQIERLSVDATKKLRQKLTDRIHEIVPGVVENEDRILREIAFYAEKVDVTEEIIRFRAHLERMDQFLSPSETTSGKTLEFLLQELGREVNTIGSKSQDATIAHYVVDLKSEIEKIREQVQNVE